MSLPIKPWEYPNNGSTGPPQYVSNTDRLHSSPVPFPGSGGGTVESTPSTVSIPPPIPPRPGNSLGASQYYGNRSYSTYSSPYSAYGSSPYSTYGGLGGGYGMGTYNSYGGGYGGMYSGGGMYGNRMGYGYPPVGPDGYNSGMPSFSQLAEASSASAFQSIESFINAFGSISAMLDSTFHAIYSSFHAVVGVADHLGRLKQIFSALAIFKFFKWVFRRFLYLIGISKIKPEDVESVWRNLSGAVEDNLGELGAESAPKISSWPIIMFLGFIFAGPYLMWKLISSFNMNSDVKDKKWASGEGEHFIAQVEYDFEGAAENELRIKRGQNIRLAPARFQPPHVKGWVLGSDGVKIGLVPTNYIKVRGKRNGSPAPNSGQLPLSSAESTFTPPPAFPSTSTFPAPTIPTPATAPPTPTPSIPTEPEKKMVTVNGNKEKVKSSQNNPKIDIPTLAPISEEAEECD